MYNKNTKKNAVIITMPLIISLCCCSRIRVDEKFPDITDIFKPTNSNINYSNNDRDYYFCLFSFNNDAKETIISNDEIIFGGNISVISLYDCEESINYNSAWLYYLPSRVYCEQSCIIEEELLFSSFLSLCSEYKTFLGYVGPDNYNYDQKSYEKDGITVPFGCPFFSIHSLYVVPVSVENKLCVTALINVIDKHIDLYELSNDSDEFFKSMAKLQRFNLLFEDGDDVFEDFPNKLRTYNDNYSQIRANYFGK